MSENVVQAGMMIFGISAIFLVSTKKHRLYGFVLGLVGQIFWFYFATHPFKFGVFFLTVAYTLSYLNGLRNNLTEDKS